MKKELTIEHRCAYAPHGVQVLAKGGLPPYADEIIIPKHCGLLVTEGKMILRPLSDLTRTITHNGREIDPLHELGDALNDENMGYPDHYIDYINPENSGKDIDWLSEPWFIVQQLLEWHFDVFDLGSDNLCVYMNPDGTLTK